MMDFEKQKLYQDPTAAETNDFDGVGAPPIEDEWSQYYHCYCTGPGPPFCFWGPPPEPCRPDCGGCCQPCPPRPEPRAKAYLADTNTQLAYATRPTLITFSRNLILNDILHTALSGKITVLVSGVYSLTLTASVGQLENKTTDLDIWVRKNGVDCAWTARRTGLPAAGRFQTVTAAYMLPLRSGDSISFYQASSMPEAGAGLFAFSPEGKPSVPSVTAAIEHIGC